MSASTSTTPVTDAAISETQGAIELAERADANPEIARVLDAYFGQISHTPAAQGLALFLGLLATQQHLTVDQSLLSLAAAVLLTGFGYGWQIVSKWLAKRKVAAPASVGK
jgi:hypothetical protein